MALAAAVQKSLVASALAGLANATAAVHYFLHCSPSFS
jgi:hypothetical protein